MNIDPEELFQVLSNSRRQHVIQLLTTGSHSIGDLAEAIARIEYDIPDGERVDSIQRKRVYISLHQTHLDTLSEAGIADRDSEFGVVPGPKFETALRTLQFVTEHDADPSLIDYVRTFARRGEA